MQTKEVTKKPELTTRLLDLSGEHTQRNSQIRIFYKTLKENKKEEMFPIHL